MILFLVSKTSKRSFHQPTFLIPMHVAVTSTRAGGMKWPWEGLRGTRVCTGCVTLAKSFLSEPETLMLTALLPTPALRLQVLSYRTGILTQPPGQAWSHRHHHHHLSAVTVSPFSSLWGRCVGACHAVPKSELSCGCSRREEALLRVSLCRTGGQRPTHSTPSVIGAALAEMAGAFAGDGPDRWDVYLSKWKPYRHLTVGSGLRPLNLSSPLTQMSS